jgi:hypothetical protein
MIQGMYAGKRPKRIVIRGWLTYAEAAKALGLTGETIRLYVWRGFLERGYFHGMPLISQTSVRHYQQHRTAPGNPKFTKRRYRKLDGEKQQEALAKLEKRNKAAEKLREKRKKLVDEAKAVDGRA